MTPAIVRTRLLDCAVEMHGPAGGHPVFLLHGFPYDPRAYDAMVPGLVSQGWRVMVPYLRGYGPTRFLSPDTPRSGQQAALGQDLLDLMDALRIERAAMVGYDWGGRAACIAAALHPHRVSALVTGEGYNIQDIAGSAMPAPPEMEHRYWYQYYLHGPRGVAGLTANRSTFARLLWRLWSPNWAFDQATFDRSAASFDNPDFVSVVVHSYRHRFGYAAGDPALEPMEAALARQPAIAVPTVALFGADDGVAGGGGAAAARPHFTGPFEARTLPGVGHNVPQEAPEATLAALGTILR